MAQMKTVKCKKCTVEFQATLARDDMQRQLDESQTFNGPDPNPNKTMETKLRIGNYDEILGWMKRAELDVFAASLQNKYG